MAPDEMTHLPEDIRKGIQDYDAMRDSGRLTFADDPQHDMPVIDGVPYITE